MKNKSDEYKNIYIQKRKQSNITRQAACDKFKTISEDRLEKIENGRTTIYPSDVIEMAEGYNAPELCNYFCANECPIGKKYVPQIEIKDLPEIVLSMLSSLNSVRKKQERLIEIAADGMVDQDEAADFTSIQNELEKISMTIEALQLWYEQKSSVNEG